jgi:hypothetical protein
MDNDIIEEFEDEIDSIIEEEYNKSKDIVKAESKEIDTSDNEEVEKAIVAMTVSDRKDAERIFDIFAPAIIAGTDRSEASKEALTKSLELKIAASRNMIELLKLKTKKPDGVNIGIFGEGLLSSKKAGIDILNIKNTLDKK